MRDAESLDVDLHAAISEVYARYGSPLVGRWVAVIEAYEADGGRSLNYGTSPDLLNWEVVGLCESASEYARALLVDELDADDDGEDDENANL